MGKKKVIAETGAGQHGVATAAAAAKFGMECEIYMGALDVERQRLNVFRMEMLGAKVHAAQEGEKNSLKKLLTLHSKHGLKTSMILSRTRICSRTSPIPNYRKRFPKSYQ